MEQQQHNLSALNPSQVDQRDPNTGNVANPEPSFNLDNYVDTGSRTDTAALLGPSSSMPSGLVMTQAQQQEFASRVDQRDVHTGNVANPEAKYNLNNYVDTGGKTDIQTLSGMPQHSMMGANPSGVGSSNQQGDRIILVFGATGHQGRAVVNSLLKSGMNWKIRAATRDVKQKAAQELRSLGVQVVKCDLKDPLEISNALQQVYGVFVVLTPFEKGVDISKELNEGYRVFDIIAKCPTIKHVVYSSVEGCDRNSGIPHFESKFLLENYMQKLQLPWTVLRPVAFMSMTLPGLNGMNFWTAMKAFMSPTKPLQMIDVKDIGEFARLAFDSPDKFMNRAISLAGDELTRDQIQTMQRKVLGNYQLALPMPKAILKGVIGKDLSLMFEWFGKAGYQANLTELRSMLPSLNTYEMFLTEYKDQSKQSVKQQMQQPQQQQAIQPNATTNAMESKVSGTIPRTTEQEIGNA